MTKNRYFLQLIYFSQSRPITKGMRIKSENWMEVVYDLLLYNTEHHVYLLLRLHLMYLQKKLQTFK